MKTKNQTGQKLPELAITKAANEDGFSTALARESATRKQAWSPLEVWRTRVKNAAPLNQSEPV